MQLAVEFPTIIGVNATEKTPILAAQAPNKPAKIKVKISTVVPVIIIIVSVIGALYYSGTFNGLLSPARDLTGTWKTSFVTRFDIQNDEGVNVAYEYRDMTWVIAATNQENVVSIEITWVTATKSGSEYTPDAQPMGLTGTISGTRLTLNAPDQGNLIYYFDNVGNFTFTSDYIEGTWHDEWGFKTGGYVYPEQKVYTATNGLKLIKQ